VKFAYSLLRYTEYKSSFRRCQKEGKNVVATIAQNGLKAGLLQQLGHTSYNHYTSGSGGGESGGVYYLRRCAIIYDYDRKSPQTTTVGLDFFRCRSYVFFVERRKWNKDLIVRLEAVTFLFSNRNATPGTTLSTGESLWVLALDSRLKHCLLRGLVARRPSLSHPTVQTTPHNWRAHSRVRNRKI